MNEWVKQYEEALAEHYDEPVIPVSEACAAIEAWGRACSDNHPELDERFVTQEQRTGAIWRDSGTFLLLHAAKSNMLARLLYGREKLRTAKCPEHDGRWQGLEFGDNVCSYGCGLTGWLPADDVEAEPAPEEPIPTIPDPPSGIRAAIEALPSLINQARSGDRHAEKMLMFSYHYGLKRDESTGQFRPHTPDEIAAARTRILGGINE